MISRKHIISGSTGPISVIFPPNESILGKDDRSGPLSVISRDVAMTANFVSKIANSTLSLLWHSETEWIIATSMCALTVQMTPLYQVKISRNSAP